MRQVIVKMAIEEATRSAQHFKHGAVVVRNGKIISTGHNKVTTKCPSHMYSIHAEMAAIKHSNERCGLVDSHIYVVRINKCGLADSKPCANCQRFMKLHGVSRVYYSTGDTAQQFKSLYIT